MADTATRRLGSMQEAATEHGVSYSRVRHWPGTPGSPDPVDRTRRPHLYDLDAIAAWRESRPPRRRTT